MPRVLLVAGVNIKNPEDWNIGIADATAHRAVTLQYLPEDSGPKFMAKYHRDLLRDCIALSGLSNRRFARYVLIRDERTIRRWLAGDSPIPEVVTSFLLRKYGSANVASD